MSLAHNISNGKRTQDVLIDQDVTFETMLLSCKTLNGLKNSGFHKPSPIQLHGIPLGKCGFDLLLEAKSGTGKTAVFTVIALEKLDLNKGLQCIMLAPTREIAAQICDVIKQIGSAYKGLNVEVVMGGLPVQNDINKFKNRNVHILVGSPGRLRHLIHDKHINTASVRLLVIDEADKLMEKSFLPDINYIFSIVPKEKQVIMSSATYPETTRAFIDNYVQCAQHICPDTNSILLGIDQKITKVKYNSNPVKQTQYRFEELLKILIKKQFKQCLIFCNYQVRVMDLYKLLTREKWPAEQLYGLQEQTDRLDAIKSLQEYKCRILISTDLAARGIDASNVDLVINFEPPIEWQTYLHRIGRAGRFGSYGLAITILSEGKEEKGFRGILDTLKLSLNNYWDGEVFNSIFNETEKIRDNPKSIEETLQLYEKSNHVMWNILTYDNKDSKSEEVEDFENLCKSYEQSICVDTETFDNLLNSFETYKKEPISYIKHNFDDKNFYESNDSYQALEAQVMSIKSNFENNKELKKIIIYDETHKSNLSSIPDDTHKTNVSTLLDDSAVDELKKAGLPTAFSSYKDKHRRNNKADVSHKCSETTKNYERKIKQKKKGMYYKEKFNKEELGCIPKENSKYCKPRSNKRNQYYIKTHDEKETEYDFSDDDYHSLSHQQFGTEVKDEMGYLRNTSRNRSLHFKFQTPKQFSEKLNQNYIQWFNQLKYTVKQIELAVYLDEMSKS